MPKLARRMYDMEGTATIIRALFNAMGSPDMISFGGGAPASEGLPVEELREICNEVLTRDRRGVEALQYGSVAGVPDLRQAVVDVLLKPKGLDASPDEIAIVNGGLETMNLMCQLYIDPGDVILVESPTFVHCVEIFEMFQARCVAVQCDDKGVVVEDVERKIKELHPKFVYVIPTFQNPTGKTLPADRRKRLAELGSEYDVIILEDDPYQELRYSGEPLRPIKYYDTTEKLRELLALGDVYCLQKKLNPDPSDLHCFGNYQKDVTVAFGRDREENGFEAKDRTLDEMLDSSEDPEFVYIFTAEQEWEFCHLYDYDVSFRKVRDVLSKESPGEEDAEPEKGQKDAPNLHI